MGRGEEEATHNQARPAHVSDVDRREASAEVKRSSRGIVPLALGLQVVTQMLVALVTMRLWPSLSGLALVAAVLVMTVSLLGPVVGVLAARAKDRSAEQLAQSKAREREMTADARRREFETRLGNALEMASSEGEVLTVAGRALSMVTGDDRVEILLADNSHAHLQRALVSGSDPAGPGCGVQSPEQCVAARRGQTQVFHDDRELDACPHLVGRPHGRCAAVCVPVSIMGRTTGVVHWSEPVPNRLDPLAVSQLEVLANQTGARLGMLRIVSESQLQATTDHLTGLMNRRAFEHNVRSLQHEGTPFSVVMADLDHFKTLNDTHGHDAGDRALRMFVGVLRSTLRPTDLACRYGGEEFVIALPDCDANAAARVCERLAEALTLANMEGSTPAFTCSFGIAPGRADASLQELVTEADAALYEAKRQGRDRWVILDHVGARANDVLRTLHPGR